VLWSKCIIFWIIFAIAWSSLTDGDLPRIRAQPTSVVSQQLPLGKSLEFCVYATNKGLEEATGLGFEPRLTNPGAVVLPLRQPILYEKVFSSLMGLYRSFYPNRQAQLQVSTSPETKSLEMFLVTTMVTVRTHTNTPHPAKKRNEAPKRAS